MKRTSRRLWNSSLCVYCHNTLLANSFSHRKRIADSSKILTNMGLIYATLGEHEAAVERFLEATNLDQYLAVASVLSIIMSEAQHSNFNTIRYFQCGVSNFLLARYELAAKDFEEALLYLRGNQAMYVPQFFVFLFISWVLVTMSNSALNFASFLPRFSSIRVSHKSIWAALRRAWLTWRMRGEKKLQMSIMLLMMPFKTAVKATRYLALLVYFKFSLSMDRTDRQLACWGSLSALGKETEEFSHKRLHGESGMCSMCGIYDDFLISS